RSAVGARPGAASHAGSSRLIRTALAPRRAYRRIAARACRHRRRKFTARAGPDCDDETHRRNEQAAKPPHGPIPPTAKLIIVFARARQLARGVPAVRFVCRPGFAKVSKEIA